MERIDGQDIWGEFDAPPVGPSFIEVTGGGACYVVEVRPCPRVELAA